jgi:endonuclease YncB( thermonuclease family)
VKGKRSVSRLWEVEVDAVMEDGRATANELPPNATLSRLGTRAALASHALLASASAFAADGTRPSRQCGIVAVRDAATLTLRCDGRDRLVRLPGLRAPRLPSLASDPHGEPFAARSRELAEAWLRGSEVELRDGLVLLDGSDLRRDLLARGLAQLETAPPAIASATAPGGDPLRAAEREARAQRRGIWSHDAWLARRSAATDPVPLPSPPPPPSRPALAALAVRPGQPSWEERKAAFEAAVAELERRSDGARSAPSPPERP